MTRDPQHRTPSVGGVFVWSTGINGFWEEGRTVTKTDIFEHPVSSEELQTICDAETLKLLLQNSTEYEERKQIRARLRVVMAEQEARTEPVENITQQQASGKLQGESLLLPLLQGLIDAPENEQTAGDSGTESGEDQRSGLIAEVTSALDKLAVSLRSDATDITSERKSSLLQLVTKLQAGLASSGPSDRRSSCQGRFNRRKQRKNRHTVGVSSEELADARRLIEEISLGDILPEREQNTDLKKQRSEGSIGQSSSCSSFRSINISQGKAPVKNLTAKPYSNSNSNAQSLSGTPSPGNTPTEASEGSFVFAEEPRTENQGHTLIVKMRDKRPSPTLQQSISLDGNKGNSHYLPDSIAQNRKSAYNPDQFEQKFHVNNIRKVTEGDRPQDSETDDDPSTLKGYSSQYQPSLIQNNMLYKPLTHEEKSNKFCTKKLKMKRANTIDIPKPLNFYQDDDSESDHQEDDYIQRRRSNYLALRGPIRVGNPINMNTVPVLDPKTENDKKFLAFINKHNDNNEAKSSLWSNQNKGSIWGNKFGKIQRNFEKAATINPVQKSQNSAMKFWRTADDSVTANNSSSHIGPRISKQSANNLRQMFEEKHRQSQMVVDKNNVITGSFTVNTKPVPPEKVYKFVPQSVPVNKFSHAPQSAFQPIKKFPPIDNVSDVVQTSKQLIKMDRNAQESDSPLYLYSPKSPQNDSTASPVTSKPWMASSGEHRVLSLAASKFGNSQSKNVVLSSDRGNNVHKITIPAGLQQPKEIDNRTAPYIIKSVPLKSTVRKLSDQYDTLTMKQTDQFMPSNTVKYIPPQSDSHYNSEIIPNSQIRHTSQPKPFQTDYSTYPQKYQQSPYLHQQNQENFGNRDNSRKQKLERSQQYQYNQKEGNINLSRSGEKHPQSYVQRSENNYNHVPNYCQPKMYQSSQHNQMFKPNEQPQDGDFVSVYRFQPTQIQNQVNSSPATDSPKLQTYHVNITTETSSFLPQQMLNNSFVPPKLESQMSNESVHEHLAVSSKVMSGPVSQQAVTVRQKSPMNRDGHAVEAAFNLKKTLQNKTANKSPSPNKTYQQCEESNMQSSKAHSMKENNKIDTNFPKPSSLKYKTEEQQSHVIYNNVRPHEHNIRDANKNIMNTYPNQQKNTKRLSSQSLHTNSAGEAVLSSKFQIPIITVPANRDASPKRPSPNQILSKSDSWHQVCLQTQTSQHKPSSKGSPQPRTVVKSKSSHSLAVPKMFEAGMSKDEMLQKKRTMEAFLAGDSKSPTPLSNENQNKTVRKSSINRTKTSEKSSSYARHNLGICRSKTLPDIVCPELLDESNVDQAFDDLFKSSS